VGAPYTDCVARNNAVRDLQDINASGEQRKELVEILRRINELDMDTSDTGSDNSDGDDPDGDGKAILSDETLERLASKMQAGCSSISAEDLPPHELKALERAAASGRLDRLLDPWHPWWLTEDARQLQLSARGTRLVSEEPSARSGGGGTALLSAVPAAPAEPLPSLKDLTRGAQPSPSLKWHLVDIT